MACLRYSPKWSLRRIGACRHRLRTPLVLLAGVLALSLNAAADETPHCSRVIRVAARPVGRFLWTTPAGEVVGPFKELLSAVGARVGCEFQYDPVSAARAAALFGDGVADILPGAQTPERDTQGRFVFLVYNRLVLFSRADRHLGISSTDDLVARQMTVDVVHGYDYGVPYRRLLEALGRNGYVVENVSLKTIAERMAAGQSDAALMTAPPFVDAALAAGLADNLQVTPLDGLPVAVGGLYLNGKALPAADSELLARAISDGVRRGEYLEFLRRSVATVAWGMSGVLDDTELHPQ